MRGLHLLRHPLSRPLRVSRRSALVLLPVSKFRIRQRNHEIIFTRAGAPVNSRS